jgi:antitoxin ParD1/3/4
MNVSLSPELEKLLQAKVESGRYGSAGEVVEKALHLLEQQEADREIHLKELRARVDKALAEVDRGEVVDGEEFMQGMLELENLAEIFDYLSRPQIREGSDGLAGLFLCHPKRS